MCTHTRACTPRRRQRWANVGKGEGGLAGAMCDCVWESSWTFEVRFRALLLFLPAATAGIFVGWVLEFDCAFWWHGYNCICETFVLKRRTSSMRLSGRVAIVTVIIIIIIIGSAVTCSGTQSAVSMSNVWGRTGQLVEIYKCGMWCNK